jgi:hypothetical protein
MIKVHKCIGRPDLFLELFLCNYLPGVFQELLENLEGLVLEAYPDAMFAQLSRSCIQLKRAELNTSALHKCLLKMNRDSGESLTPFARAHETLG